MTYYEEIIVDGPASLLVNEISARRPQTPADVLDLETHDPINNWVYFGTTEQGVQAVDEFVKTRLASVDQAALEKFEPAGPIQLAVLWLDGEVRFHHFPSVQIRSHWLTEEAGSPVHVFTFIVI